jgi:hypothetical protein
MAQQGTANMYDGWEERFILAMDFKNFVPCIQSLKLDGKVKGCDTLHLNSQLPYSLFITSSSWRPVVQKIIWFLNLDQEGQTEESNQFFYLPQFEKDMYLRHTELLWQQRQILVEKRKPPKMNPDRGSAKAATKRRS